MMDWMFFAIDDDVGFHRSVLIVYDLVSTAAAAIQATKHNDPRTAQAVVLTLEHWGQTGTVLHADGVHSTRALVRPVVAPR